MRFARIGLLIIVVAAVAACHRGPSEQEKQVMAQLAHSMKTHCIGRYLVDLPGSFQWLSPDLTLYYGRDEHFKTLEVQVLDYRATPEYIDTAVMERATRIAAVTNLGTGKSNLLAKVKERDSHSTMLRYYSGTEGIAGIEHELHFLVGSAYVLIKGSSYENVPALTPADQDLTETVELRMLKLAANIRPVTDPEKAGAGFCLDTVVVDSDNDYEVATFYLKQSQGKFKVMSLELNTSSFNEHNAKESGLIERGEKFMALMSSMKTLRKAGMVLGGMPAEEILTTMTVDGRDTQYFVSKTRPPEPGLATPKLHFEFQGGRADGGTADVPSPITNNEAIGVWDSIMKSVRPRPAAVRPPAH